MNIRLFAFSGALVALTTVLALEPAAASSKLSSRWVGQEAGTFFAAYGPPTGDMAQGSKTIYQWRGGYSSRKVAAIKDKKGKITARARKDRLVCAVKLTVDSRYQIDKIDVVVDKPGIKGSPTWCEQYLDAAR